MKIYNFFNPLTLYDEFVTYCQNFDSKIRRAHQKNFLWASRLWVGRRKEPILDYVQKNDKKKEFKQSRVKENENLQNLFNPLNHLQTMQFSGKRDDPHSECSKGKRTRLGCCDVWFSSGPQGILHPSPRTTKIWQAADNVRKLPHRTCFLWSHWHDDKREWNEVHLDTGRGLGRRFHGGFSEG